MTAKLHCGQRPELESRKPAGLLPGLRERLYSDGFSDVAGVDEGSLSRNSLHGRGVSLFSGKTAAAGDRVPSRIEIENCSSWLDSEIAFTLSRFGDPRLAKLALAQFIEPVPALSEVIGQMRTVKRAGKRFDIIALLIPPELLLGIASSQENLLLGGRSN